eukprot:s259_g5.t1
MPYRNDVLRAQGQREECSEEVRYDMEMQLLVQTSLDSRLTEYATTVLKSLRCGARLCHLPVSTGRPPDLGRDRGTMSTQAKRDSAGI